MLRTLRVVFALVATALAFELMAAAPAQASESDYLRLMVQKYPFLTTQQLLDEGYKVCQAERNGMISADAVKMVQQDLVVAVGVGVDIVSTAAVQLGC